MPCTCTSCRRHLNLGIGHSVFYILTTSHTMALKTITLVHLIEWITYTNHADSVWCHTFWQKPPTCLIHHLFCKGKCLVSTILPLSGEKKAMDLGIYPESLTSFIVVFLVVGGWGEILHNWGFSISWLDKQQTSYRALLKCRSIRKTADWKATAAHWHNW